VVRVHVRLQASMHRVCSHTHRVDTENIVRVHVRLQASMHRVCGHTHTQG